MAEADHVLGIGVTSSAEATEVAGLVEATLRSAGIPRGRVGLVATVDARAHHPALAALGWPVVAFSWAELAAAAAPADPALPAAASADPAAPGPPGPDPSPDPGRRAVAEPAALLAAGTGAVLVVAKRRSARATVAVARAESHGGAHTPQRRAQLSSAGCAGQQLMTRVQVPGDDSRSEVVAEVRPR